MALFVDRPVSLSKAVQQPICETGMQHENGNGTVAGNGTATGNGAATGSGTATSHGIGNGTGNKPLGTWTLAGHTYTNYAEFCEARDRRQREFLTRSGGAKSDELGPPLVVPEDATPESFQSEPEWPVSSEIDEALKNRFRLFSGTQLKSATNTRYLIPGILAVGQPGGIYGGFKTLKTSLAADLLISLASGTPFLGRFPVAKPGRVLFLSGEAGLEALKATADRICRERGLSLESLENFHLSPDLPRLDRPVDVMALRELIEIEQPVCLVIDPISLAMGDSNSRNPFAVGALLRELVELCDTTGCAILVVHHAKRSHKAGSPPTLDDIAWSGFAEFSAQWLLLSRRRPYNPDTGHHELWLSAGGRAGHAGLWALDVDEGAPPALPDEGPLPSADEDRRTWRPALRSVAWAEAQADEQFVATREDRQLRRRAMAVERQSQRVLELLAAYPDGDRTARFMRDELGVSGDRMTRLLDRLVEQGQIVKNEDRSFDSRRPIVTYARVQVMDLSLTAIKAGRVSRPDEKTYDPKMGHWVSRGNAPAPGAAGVGGGGMSCAAGRGIGDESARAMGRDAVFHRENSRDLPTANNQRDAAASVPSHPSVAAPGPGALPLA
jgi:AAA domain